MTLRSLFVAICAFSAAPVGLGCASPDAGPDDMEAFDSDADEADSEGDDDELEPEDAPRAEPLPPRVPPYHTGECDLVDGGFDDCRWGDELGLQYCDGGMWGPCVLEPMCDPGETRVEECAFGPTEQRCILLTGVPAWEECGFTPLVLSFDGREPTFDEGVEAFELSDGSGECLAREWPGADTPWLAIDLDGSGAIENGRELFGSASPTLDGSPPTDGFDALSDLDTDGDGRIGPRDDAWAKLLLWSDHDRDRRSSAWELVPLSASGLSFIELSHTIERRCDDRGNCGIERSRFSFSSSDRGSSTGTVIDVHIPCD